MRRHELDLSVYLITDTALCAAFGVPATVREAVAGGATLVQLRDPHATDDDVISLGRAIMAELDGTGVPLIINDRVHLVAAIGADGAHIGQGDMDPRAARELLGPDAVLGLSVTTLEQVAAAAALPDGTLDYLGVGPLRATASKPDHATPTGLALTERLIAASPLPTCVIGGVTAADAADLHAARAGGMAVISAICGQPSPRLATAELAAAWAASAPPPAVLSIAGSDPSGGAGIQADLKTFSALGAYGMCVLTALTAQNTTGVTGVHTVPTAFVGEQIETLVADVRVDAVKIGMLSSAALAETVGGYLQEAFAHLPVVLDPVMVATSGARLLEDDAVDAVRALLPLADVITPNLPEAAVLLGDEAATDEAALADQARRLLGLGAARVYLKGGHLAGRQDALDLFIGADVDERLAAPWVHTHNTHGTGCSLSSALAALRPQRRDWASTGRDAKAWLTSALAAADTLHIGHGSGPVHHFHQLWSRP